MLQSAWSEAAAWVEAIGTIGAVVGAAWVASAESRASRKREERAADETKKREDRSALATRTAALNLAILASTQIHDLNVLLRDQAWRGRVARVSASRMLLATERMLTTFPIQSLEDAPSMVEFSRFPAALATAAEVYTNLETAVRAAKATERETIFLEYTKQMERLDAATKRSLLALRVALKFELETDHRAQPGLPATDPIQPNARGSDALTRFGDGSSTPSPTRREA